MRTYPIATRFGSINIPADAFATVRNRVVRCNSVYAIQRGYYFDVLTKLAKQAQAKPDTFPPTARDLLRDY